MKNDFLKPEDYMEPRCLLCEEPYGSKPEIKSVPQQRIIEKMDEYLSRKDYEGAERHLLYWLEEAKLGQDLRGELSIRNELIGHYRKRGEKEKAFASIREAEKLLTLLDFEGTISSGTTYTNIATAYYTFKDYETSYQYFKKAQNVYENNKRTDPALLGGLYNNMALACAALKDYTTACTLYQKALDVMETIEDGKPEQAITLLNLANALEAEKGMEQAEEEIFSLLDCAEELLDQAAQTMEHGTAAVSGYYAFVCESCASVFSYYGYFLTAEKLNGRAKDIYERNGTVERLF